LLGHLRFYNTVKATLPKDAHHNYVFGEIGRRWFSKEGAYYIDLWPFSEPLLVVLSGVLATQATQTLTRIATQKPHQLRAWFRPITGGPNLVEMPEAEWRPWRAVFNKGFSAVHVQSLVPGMVDEARVYCDILRRHARAGGMFSLDAITMRFIMDLIGRTVLYV
jgi:cytochrome P450